MNDVSQVSECSVRKCMVLVSPTEDNCDICVEELLKYGGSYVVGSEVTCWNCHTSLRMERLDLDKIDNPLDDMSILRSQDGKIYDYTKPENVNSIEVVKAYIDITQWNMQQAFDFIVGKGFNLPTNQSIDEQRGILSCYKGDSEQIPGHCYVPLVGGIVLQLSVK